MIAAFSPDTMLWNIERTVSEIFIPLLTNKCIGDKGTDLLSHKVKKELLPCLRSFTSALRVAEKIYGEGCVIKKFPAEAYTLKTLDDSMEFLSTTDGQERLETKKKLHYILFLIVI